MNMLIGKQECPAEDGRTIEVYNPATGELIDTVPSATKNDCEKCLEVAQEGKRIWKDIPQRERANIILKAAEMIDAEKDAIATILCRETGKVYAQALGEVVCARELFKGYAEKGKFCYDTVLPSENDLITVKREPLGVIACIIPFNFPIELYAHKVAPALVTGNAVIVKPSSDTPLSAIYITNVLRRAGVPAEVLQVITGSGATVGEWLSSSPKVNAISLTGSTSVGKGVLANSAKYLSRVFLELGGNDCFIVTDDVDIDKAADAAVACRTYSGGQVCSAAKRFIVNNKVKKEFTDCLIEKLKAFNVGDPFDNEVQMGSLISEKAANEVVAQVEYTVKQGAKLVFGGERKENAFYMPAVLTDVTADMDIAKDLEVFGPVFPIIGVDSDEEAIAVANQSSYGLAGNVCCRDIARGYKIADQIDTGGMIVNPAYVYRTFDMPFGGHKQSGIGNEGFFNTMEEMTQLKSIVLTGIKG